MKTCLPEDLRDYLLTRPRLSRRQKATMVELAAQYRETPGKPHELAARYVKRSLKSGWPGGC